MTRARATARLSGIAITLTLWTFASSGVRGEMDDAFIEGRFFDPSSKEELSVSRWMHGLELRRGSGEVVWREEFGVYLSESFGTCRDLDSGLDRVFFATSSGGSDGAMVLHLLGSDGNGRFVRVFDDATAAPELGRYFHFPEKPDDPWRFEPVAGLICAGTDYLGRRRMGWRILEALAPGNGPTLLETDADERILPQTLPSRELDARLVQALLRLQESLGLGFAHTTLAETDLWRFELVYQLHSSDSWGVLLLEDKSDSSWRSVYRLPEGDSKSFLLEPVVIGLGTEAARIDFCTTCTNWPNGPDARLDLRTLELGPGPARE